jgi:hypothetical protein
MLQALRGEGMRAFYRWARKRLHSLFPRLPERSRLGRLLNQHALETQRFLAEPTLLGICDSYGIELLHPKRHGRSRRQIAKKGLSNWRWIPPRGTRCQAGAALEQLWPGRLLELPRR